MQQISELAEVMIEITKDLKSVLFDLDGTLADTESLKARALADAVMTFGGIVSPEIYRNVMGKSWEIVTTRFFKEAGLDVPLAEFDPIFRTRYAQLIETELEDRRNAKEFLEKLQAKGLLIGVVSSAAPWMIEKVLDRLKLTSSVQMIIHGDETLRHKPDPECYLVALKKLKVSASEAIAFEDTEAGFQAATTAGLKVYGMKHSLNSLHDFSLCEGIIESFKGYIA